MDFPILNYVLLIGFEVWALQCAVVFGKLLFCWILNFCLIAVVARVTGLFMFFSLIAIRFGFNILDQNEPKGLYLLGFLMEFHYI